ncbi:MAG: hypothetical protein NTW41_03645 [Verrucomicrobia bacterium]|nr:hypothetical protein [Verrucomicrobiota bacterium]
MKPCESTEIPNSPLGEGTVNERHFAMKEAWKNKPGNRYTAEELRAPGVPGEWDLVASAEVYLWPCP